jgi:two-component system cell cycle sensor histidine kinase/response regulator CckA
VLHLREFVDDVGASIRPLIGDRIDLAIITGPGLGPVLADEQQLRQAIRCLAETASDVMPEGGRFTIEARNCSPDSAEAGPSVADPESYARLAVSDTARGLTLDIRLQRGDATERAGDSAGKPANPKGTILLVEDDVALRRVVYRALTGKSFKVLEAPTAFDACTIARDYQGPIHLLLTDLSMPGMGGRELADLLTADRPHLAVLFMSGYVDDSNAHQVDHDPRTGFLGKPFCRDILLKRVRELLNHAAPEAA